MSLTGLAWRSLRARPLRSLLSGLGVALGVAVLFAGLATDAGIEASVNSTVRDLVGHADLRVAAFGERGLAPDTVQTIRETPGVEVIAPALQRRTYLGPSIEAGVALPPPVTVLGIDPAAEPQLHGPSRTFQIDFAQPVPAVHQTRSPGFASSHRRACRRFAHV